MDYSSKIKLLEKQILYEFPEAKPHLDKISWIDKTYEGHLEPSFENIPDEQLKNNLKKWWDEEYSKL